MRALDTASSLLGLAHELCDHGFAAALRYISPNTQAHPSKQLTHEEALALRNSGLRVGMVWETVPTSSLYFSADKGAEDGRRAIAAAKNLCLPPGGALFFAVDYDATEQDLAGSIRPYFEAIHTVLRAHGLLTGIYGSGLALDRILEAGLAHFGWQAQSTGWRGYQPAHERAAILQGGSTKLRGVDVDLDHVADPECLW